MRRSDLIEAIYRDFPDLNSRARAQKAVTVIFDTIIEAVADGNRVELRGFGSFSSKTHSARTGRNPRTGEPVDIPETRVTTFRTSKPLHRRMNHVSETDVGSGISPNERNDRVSQSAGPPQVFRHTIKD